MTSLEPPETRSSIDWQHAVVRVVGGPRPDAMSAPGWLDLPWKLLAVAALASQLFALPVFSYMGWFLSSLVHEMGHAAFAWGVGMPAFPAIRLDGHAAAMHSAQVPWLAFAIAGGLAYLAWLRREHVPQAVALGALAVAFPCIAFANAARELLFLLMGHGGELTFATIALVRATNDEDHGTLERGLYATLAWYLLWKNATLFFGLATSTQALIEYSGSGSFGMTNDLIRAAEDVLGWPVPRVAAWMLAATIAVPPAALAIRRLARA